MSEATVERITFDVETERVLQILSSEIYDSPKAFLRENVQNAYDAILMRCTAEGLPIASRTIQITVGDGETIRRRRRHRHDRRGAEESTSGEPDRAEKHLISHSGLV